MMREQKWVVVPVNMSDNECTELTKTNGACGYIRGVPPSLMIQATSESWTLPHIWTETWEEID